MAQVYVIDRRTNELISEEFNSAISGINAGIYRIAEPTELEQAPTAPGKGWFVSAEDRMTQALDQNRLPTALAETHDEGPPLAPNWFGEYQQEKSQQEILQAEEDRLKGQVQGSGPPVTEEVKDQNPVIYKNLSKADQIKYIKNLPTANKEERFLKDTLISAKEKQLKGQALTIEEHKAIEKESNGIFPVNLEKQEVIAKKIEAKRDEKGGTGQGTLEDFLTNPVNTTLDLIKQGTDTAGSNLQGFADTVLNPAKAPEEGKETIGENIETVKNLIDAGSQEVKKEVTPIQEALDEELKNAKEEAAKKLAALKAEWEKIYGPIQVGWNDMKTSITGTSSEDLATMLGLTPNKDPQGQTLGGQTQGGVSLQDIYGFGDQKNQGAGLRTAPNITSRNATVGNEVAPNLAPVANVNPFNIGSVGNVNTPIIKKAAPIQSTPTQTINDIGPINVQKALSLTSPTVAPAQQVTTPTLAKSEFAPQQLNLANTLSDRVSGKSPSVAELQLKQTTDRNLDQALSLGASTGGRDVANTSRLISRNLGDINQQAVGQASLLRAQEQRDAENAYAGLLATGRGQDFQEAQTTADFQQKAGFANQATAAQIGISQAGLEKDVGISNQQAQLAQSQLQASLERDTALANQQSARELALADAERRKSYDLANLGVEQETNLTQGQLDASVALANQEKQRQMVLAQAEINRDVAFANQAKDINLATTAASIARDVGIANMDTNARVQLANSAGFNAAQIANAESQIEQAKIDDAKLNSYVQALLQDKTITTDERISEANRIAELRKTLVNAEVAKYVGQLQAWAQAIGGVAQGAGSLLGSRASGGAAAPKP